MTMLDPQAPTGGARIIGGGSGDGPGPEIMAAATLDGNKVISADGEHVGKISDIMLDVRSGRVAYAVLAQGGFLGIGDHLHAIPWSALTLDTAVEILSLPDRIRGFGPVKEKSVEDARARYAQLAKDLTNPPPAPRQIAAE